MKLILILATLLTLTMPGLSIAKNCNVRTESGPVAYHLLKLLGYNPVPIVTITEDSFNTHMKLYITGISNSEGTCVDARGRGVQKFTVTASLINRDGIIDRVIGQDIPTGPDNNEARYACASREAAIANAIMKLKPCHEIK